MPIRIRDTNNRLRYSSGGDANVFDSGSSTDNAIARFDGTNGRIVQNSGITIADGASGTLAGSNSGDATLDGSYDYITISGQVITRNPIDLAADISGYLPTGNVAGWQVRLPGGRLTLSSGVPSTYTDVTSSTTVYYTPYKHNLIDLWDGSRWVPVSYSETSLALGTVSSDSNYDVFAYVSSGSLALEKLIWTNDSTRATAVTFQDGRLCKSGDKTRLFLGTFRTVSTSATCDEQTRRFLSNWYNAEPRMLHTCPGYSDDNANTTYTTSSTTWVEANSGTGSKLQFIICYPGYEAAIHASVAMNTGVGAGFTGLAYDSSSAPNKSLSWVGSEFPRGLFMSLDKDPLAGYHYFDLLIRVSSGTTTWIADLARGTDPNDSEMTSLNGIVWG